MNHSAETKNPKPVVAVSPPSAERAEASALHAAATFFPSRKKAVKVSLATYFRGLAALVWSSLRHPFDPNMVDLMTGKTVGPYRPNR